MNQTTTNHTPIHFMDYALSHGFGEVHVKIDSASGMKAIIALHSTKLGPALGGCRFVEYVNNDAAIQDAMRLALGMSAKAALANLPLGGGKAVIIKPSSDYDRTAYLKAFGHFVHSLDGRYITALDSGTNLEDMDIIAELTPYVASRSSHGDPSPSTARGVFRGIEVSVEFKLGKSSLNGLHVAIKGLGHVGFLLAKDLHEAGARLTVADINPTLTQRAAEAFNATVVSSEMIHTVPCDVFAPCALGGVVNDNTIDQFQTTIIAGAANNQLAHTYHGQMLHDRGILYAPDYVINAGGLIFAHSRYIESPNSIIQEGIHAIGNTLLEIYERSVFENRPTNLISDKIAQERLA